MTDFCSLDNWDETIPINKGLQRKSRFVGEAKDRGKMMC
jgi:hypothetical protein